jgi:hypothetical protein
MNFSLSRTSHQSTSCRIYKHRSNIPHHSSRQDHMPAEQKDGLFISRHLRTAQLCLAPSQTQIRQVLLFPLQLISAGCTLQTHILRCDHMET